MRSTFATLQSSCVTVQARLDPTLQAGFHPAKLVGKGDFAGVRENWHKVPCTIEQEEHIGADQIFPLLRTESWYTPTIKHDCPRTALAASLRACSNKVRFDPKVFADYQHWFRTIYIPEFKTYIDNDLWDVDLEVWLKRFNKTYQMGMRRAVDSEHVNHQIPMRYGAFPKIEQQFTTVPHELKETDLNTVKERQICGPSDEKKVWGNPFINILEEIASKYMKEYCGRANWIEICASLDEIDQNIPGVVWGAADGSGFDMTQHPEMNSLMNELLEMSARHPNITWREPLTVEKFLECVKGSLVLKVDVNRGDLKYEALGRASGDGWTTFGNTMLMISYWRYCYYKAGFKKGSFGLKVKGDDTLFAHKPSALFDKYQALIFTKTKDAQEHGLGQICTKIKFGDITELDFLSNEFFRTEDGRLRMTRIPARVLQTLCWSTKLPKNGSIQDRQELCYSKGACLQAWASDLPIWGVLARKMMSLGVKGRLSEWNQYSDGDRVWHQGRSDYRSYLLYLAEHYGITPDDVSRVEDRIMSLRTLSGVCEVPELERFYKPLVSDLYH